MPQSVQRERTKIIPGAPLSVPSVALPQPTPTYHLDLVFAPECKFRCGNWNARVGSLKPHKSIILQSSIIEGPPKACINAGGHWDGRSTMLPLGEQMSVGCDSGLDRAAAAGCDAVCIRYSCSASNILALTARRTCHCRPKGIHTRRCRRQTTRVGTEVCIEPRTFVRQATMPVHQVS